MKKNIYIILILIAGIAISCKDMNDLSDKYLDLGETVYLQRVDSLEVLPGKNRVRFNYLLISDPKIEQTVITYNNGADSVVFDISKTHEIDTLTFDINNLPEKDYVFNIYNRNSQNMKSVPVEAVTTVFGERYQSRLINRIPVVSRDDKGNLVINWEKAGEDLGMNLFYTNKAGETKMEKLGKEDLTTILADVDLSKDVTFETFYLPRENAIDTFKVNPSKLVLPEEFLYNKKLIKEHALTKDNRGRSWGGSVDKLFDNALNSGNFYHTGQWNDGPPCTFTFDLGRNAKLSRIKIDGRPGQPLRIPQNMDIWITDNIEGADTELNCQDEGWEAEAKSKGWHRIAIHQGTIKPGGHGVIELKFDSEIPEGRYVRLRIGNIWDNGKYLNLGEITLWER
ncbi:hypothetical protein EMN47_04050 [Prolixibacteraceae bacterium JC049]|nr:hypothetical protein [Prolixibacteraceae bacterium JC049]